MKNCRENQQIDWKKCFEYLYTVVVRAVYLMELDQNEIQRDYIAAAAQTRDSGGATLRPAICEITLTASDQASRTRDTRLSARVCACAS